LTPIAAAPGEPSTFEVYVLSGATCGGCGGKVTAQTKRRLRCRMASQHAGCAEPSVAASALEEFFGDWIMKALTLEPRDLARAAAIVRAKLHRGSDAQKATRIGTAMKRITEAFTWGALEEVDYRQQLETLRAQLAVAGGGAPGAADPGGHAHCAGHPAHLGARDARAAEAHGLVGVQPDPDLERRDRLSASEAGDSGPARCGSSPMRSRPESGTEM